MSPASDGTYFCTTCWRNHVYGKSEGNWLWKEHQEYALILDEELLDALAERAMETQTHRDELIAEYIQRGLEKDGVL